MPACCTSIVPTSPASRVDQVRFDLRNATALDPAHGQRPKEILCMGLGRQQYPNAV